MSVNSKAVITYRQRTKLKAVQYLGGKCSICGYNKCLGSLHFHHTDPTQKDFKISTGNTISFERLKPELDKCILVCSNCHGELHYGDTLVELLGPPKESFCSVCGTKLKDYRAFCCNSCRQRPTKIVWPSDTELKELLKSLSYVKIGTLLGVSDVAVKKHCKKLGLV